MQAGVTMQTYLETGGSGDENIFILPSITKGVHPAGVIFLLPAATMRFNPRLNRTVQPRKKGGSWGYEPPWGGEAS